MSTYDHKKVLSDYANGRMDVEMATGHSLQHIDKLYQAQSTANTRRQEIRDQATKLEKEVKTLRSKVKRLQALANKLAALSLTVYNMKDDVDNLKTHLSPQDAGKGDTSAKN